MEKSSDGTKAKMLLATVRGDVHDIGKNLVDIILSNNGFSVVNLGIKVPPSEIIKALKEHKPDFIGLSGLLVKSAQEMVATADELRAHGVNIPILVGGAALTERFTYGRIAEKYDGVVAYARDAMTGLDLANRLFDDAKKPALLELVDQKKREARAAIDEKANAQAGAGPSARVIISHDVEPPRPPDTQLHVLDTLPLEGLWSFINPMMLYARHLGLKGNVHTLAAQGDARAKELLSIVKSVEDEVLARDLLVAKAMYRFFKAQSEGDALVLMDASSGGDKVAARFTFPRQKDGEQRCLSDLVPAASTGKSDTIGMFVTTCQGKKSPVRVLAEEMKNKGELLKSHVIQALALETAEAAAEWLHQKMRGMWGIPDAAGIPMQDLFSARYRGRRYSFGYPACPRLEDQAILWKVLEPNKHIGVELTDGFMMDPEASVSALVFHHPQATYFSVGDEAAR
jgi:5-methyltetrahydrofolate--homocysteine methyltransferase